MVRPATTIWPSVAWTRFGAVDVGYPVAGGARSAVVIAADIQYSSIVHERVRTLNEVAPYQPGRFYQRELPAILAVVPTDLDLLIVDGYVQLDPTGRPGLGAYVHSALSTPVIGVAKTAYGAATHARTVVRGAARRPLYVTAAGLDSGDAAAIVAAMAGRFRLPDALRRVDQLSRTADSASPPNG
jgi:deoxyribonuclease V